VLFFRTTQPSKKLAEKYLGPFEIIGQAGTRAYILWLPDSLRAVHPVFHVSMLKPTTPNSIPNRVQSPPPPVKINGETEYEISEILDTKIDERRKPCNLLYLVCWAGYEGTDEEMSWVLATELSHLAELVTDFHSAYPAKPGPWVP
jgi:Chromo (CHRromatin Organisation MOdifier) domain